MLSVVLLNVIMLSVVAPAFDVWSQDLGLKLQLYLNSGKMLEKQKRESFCHKKIMFLYLFFFNKIHKDLKIGLDR